MADLQLITSKRDIYFATTAPEFIPKDFRIKGQDNEYNSDTGASTTMPISRNGSISGGSGGESNGKLTGAPNAFGHFSNERILEIKHKIEKIDVQQSVIGEETDLAASDDDDYDTDLHINTVDNLNKLQPVPVDGDQSPCMHRVRSLQKPKPSTTGGCADELRRQISKSSSCGDTPAYASCCASTADGQTYGSGKHLDEPGVPPNSPKRDSIITTSSTSDITVSPIKYHTKSYQHHRTIHHLLHNNHMQLCDHHGVGGAQHHSHHGQTVTAAASTTTTTAEKIKPLRIFRIPLANLTGAHSHYHTHSSSGGGGSGATVGQSAKVSKIQAHKIAEDQLEVDATIARASAELNESGCKAEQGSSDELKLNVNSSFSGSNNSCSGSNIHCTSDTEILSSL